MPARYRKYLEFIILLLVAAGIVWWFGRKLDWNQVKSALAASDWRLILLAGTVVLGGVFLSGHKMASFSGPDHQSQSARNLDRDNGWIWSVLTIGRAGEVVRPLVLPMRDKRVRPAASFVTIFVERVYDSLTVMLLFAVSLMWFSPSVADFRVCARPAIGFRACRRAFPGHWAPDLVSVALANRHRLD